MKKNKIMIGVSIFVVISLALGLGLGLGLKKDSPSNDDPPINERPEEWGNINYLGDVIHPDDVISSEEVVAPPKSGYAQFDEGLYGSEFSLDNNHLTESISELTYIEIIEYDWNAFNNIKGNNISIDQLDRIDSFFWYSKDYWTNTFYWNLQNFSTNGLIWYEFFQNSYSEFEIDLSALNAINDGYYLDEEYNLIEINLDNYESNYSDIRYYTDNIIDNRIFINVIEISDLNFYYDISNKLLSFNIDDYTNIYIPNFEWNEHTYSTINYNYIDYLNMSIYLDESNNCQGSGIDLLWIDFNINYVFVGYLYFEIGDSLPEPLLFEYSGCLTSFTFNDRPFIDPSIPQNPIPIKPF